MLDLFSSGIIAVWLQNAKIDTPKVDLSEFLTWQGAPLFIFPTESDNITKSVMDQYLKELSSMNIKPENQGLWIQSNTTLLGEQKGNIPVPAASISKVATTLVTLYKLKPNYQFITKIGMNGTLEKGVLKGDLIIIGSGDPYFTWEEAIALGNSLNKIGIKTVQGNLIITDKFYMNYNENPQKSGEFFQLAVNSKRWTPLITKHYEEMKIKIPKSQLEITGKIQVVKQPPEYKLLINHKSLPLVQIIKEMNIYSNNDMAEMLAKYIGGSSIVAKEAALISGVPPTEIQMINGSGLTMKNLISPRAACSMFMAIQRYLSNYNMTIADFFPVSGRDKTGTLLQRKIPNATIIKTGTLDQVSALVGALPTQEHGVIWFGILNSGEDVLTFRQQQDLLLQNLQKKWGIPQQELPIIKTTQNIPEGTLGDITRNSIN